MLDAVDVRQGAGNQVPLTHSAGNP
jgi:hypothetical protein